MHYHLIGIGGTSMAGIAHVLRAQGHAVSGSDSRTTGHGPELIPEATDVVIFTEAITPDSPGYEELAAARARQLTTVRRIEFIAQMMEGRYSVAVAGAHGKSTTTALIGWVLAAAGLDPTVFIGADLTAFGGSARAGKGRYVVTEACEWNRQFLTLHPTVLVLTTLDREHLDTYPGGTDEIMAAFQQAIAKTDPNGFIVANIDDPHIQQILEGSTRRILRFGHAEGAVYRILSAEATSDGQLGVSIQLPAGNAIYAVSSLVGTHHSVNVTAALAALDGLKLPLPVVTTALTSFPGLKRRFERYRDDPTLTVIDDYAHHPTEIRSTIVAARQRYPNRRLVVVFQPHLSERTTDLFEAFIGAFRRADLVIVAETYEPAGRAVSSEARGSDQLVHALKLQGIDAALSSDVPETGTLLRSRLREGDVVLTVGATSIWRVAESLKTWSVDER